MYGIHNNETLPAGLSRVLAAEAGALAHSLEFGSGGAAESVHRLRVSGKHIRALLRLLPRSEACRQAEAAVAELARSCSAARDARVVFELAQRLRKSDGRPGAHSAVMRWLADNAAAAEVACTVPPAQRAAVAAQLDPAVLIPADLTREQVCAALARTDKRVRRAYARALGSRAPADMHRLRIRAKRLMLQRRLCAALECTPTAADWEAWEVPAELLGAAHDAAVLLDLLDAEHARAGSKKSFARLRELTADYLRSADAEALVACAALLAPPEDTAGSSV